MRRGNNVFLNCIREQKDVLHDGGNTAAQLTQAEFADIHVVEINRAARRVVKAAEQLDQGRLAASGRAHDTDRFACLHMEMDVVKNLMLVLLMERNVLEADIAGHFRQDNRFFRFLNRRLLAEMYVIAAFLTAMAYWKHRENIKRLLSGTERKTYLFKKNKEALN